MHRYDRPLIAVALCLAALAGFVDALGFLSMGGFFVSFMSGNTTHLAVAIGSVDPAPAWRAATLIIAFIAGVMAGTLVAHAVPFQRKPAVLAAVTLLLTAAALCHMLQFDQAALLLTAVAMGAENGVFQRDGEVTIGVTYMTGTLVRFAQRAALALVGGDGRGWPSYLLLWLGFIAGALVGTGIFLLTGLNALWIAAGICAVMTATVARLVRIR
ncbi:YoaK family protein [Sphingomonas crusticola]|uniref:YoaK family protein n=1 Tax=Sphingomonas crusticola TaxID=1697973 RepID=UPI000E2491CB|nr:YoaK family protein [Sphingomonas crusticola]